MMSGLARGLPQLESVFMKNKTPTVSAAFKFYEPSKQEISRYAFQIYTYENCQQGNDVEHWLEAAAYLRAGMLLRAPLA